MSKPHHRKSGSKPARRPIIRARRPSTLPDLTQAPQEAWARFANEILSLFPCPICSSVNGEVLADDEAPGIEQARTAGAKGPAIRCNDCGYLGTLDLGSLAETGIKRDHAERAFAAVIAQKQRGPALVQRERSLTDLTGTPEQARDLLGKILALFPCPDCGSTDRRPIEDADADPRIGEGRALGLKGVPIRCNGCAGLGIIDPNEIVSTLDPNQLAGVVMSVLAPKGGPS